MAKSATVAKSSRGTEAQDRSLLDTYKATLKKLVARGKEQGYVTYEELNAVLPQEQVSSDQIEVVMTMLSEMGINLIDGEESEDNEDGSAHKSKKAVIEKEANEEYERTEDPIRMYLREMGSVKLLSREGEIAIAKRIEAGREILINGICQSPLTIRAIIEWRDMLVNGEVLLREIIDLGATYIDNREGNGADRSEAQNADAKTLKAEAEKPGDEEDDEEESNVSLVAMEMALKPIVLETCDLIAKTYKRFRKVQNARMQAAMKHQELTPQQEKRYQKLQGELVALVQSVHLHNNRVEALIDQLYGINHRLITLEGRLLRLADRHGVPRLEFLKVYVSCELDPRWLSRVRRLKGNGWAIFATKEREEIEEIRAEIARVAAETGLPIGEYKRIVTTVQKGEREAGQAKTRISFSHSKDP